MTNSDYQDIYRETLLCLGQELEIGAPFLQSDGTWGCHIGDRLLTEDQVLELWWGPVIAARIRRDRGRRRPVPEEVMQDA